MKSKLFISLLLSLVMLFALAAPALAGKPSRGDLMRSLNQEGPWEPGMKYQYAVQVTHNNYVKVTIVLKGQTENNDYCVWVYDDYDQEYYYIGTFQTDSDGNARYRGVTGDSLPSTPSPRALKIVVRNITAEPPTPLPAFIDLDAGCFMASWNDATFN
jgi:hypothetical protein